MLRSLEQAILIAAHRLTGDTYADTDSDAIGKVLESEGRKLPALFPYKRLFLRLKEEGYLSNAYGVADGKVIHIELSDRGREQAEVNLDPMEQVYSDTRRMLGSDSFAEAYPGAFQSWSEAEELLFGDDPQAQLATIGFKLRDATQIFATALVNEHKPPDGDPEVSHAKNRLRDVIGMYAPQLGNRRPAVLEAMARLWDADVDLIQRQTHGNEQSVSLTVNDARRVVSLTMFLMVEFATILDEVEPPPPPALEDG